jgi:1-acyl-sn-glycerol-3-phosphate acyltransferase
VSTDAPAIQHLSPDLNVVDHNPFQRWMWLKCAAGIRFFLRQYFHFEVIGREKIPMTGPLVLASSHACFIDPMIVGAASPRVVQYMMYSTFYYTWARRIFQFYGALPIDEKDFRESLRSGMYILENGGCVGVFPEGAMTFDGNMLPAKPGALFLAQKTGAPVVPLAIKGNFEAWPRTRAIPRRSKITVIAHDPFVIEKGSSRKQLAALTERMMDQLAATLGVGRHKEMPKEVLQLETATAKSTF